MRLNKRLFGLLFLSGIMIVPSVSEAAGTKVGFVNVPEIMSKAPQAKAARDQLQKEFKPRENQLGQLHQAIQKQKNNLQRNSSAMSAKQKQQAEAQLQAKEKNFNKKLTQFRQDFGSKRQQVLQSLQNTISNTIKRIAKRDHYDMILSDNVVYVQDKYNLTDQVLSDLKKSAK
ncbi:OmpH family outer membrane protein [Acidihalobacter prosperus]